MDDGYIGQIELLPFNFTPRSWSLCNGTILSVAPNQALFSLIGNRFGGDGKTTFALPNLLGAEPIPGTAYYICMNGLYPTHS